jgi:hypothetical protein
MTTSRLLLAITLLAALAACEIGGHETRTGAGASCVAISGACTENSQCCSYGCVSGACAVNPVEGGVCRTTTDCAAGRLCKSEACTTATAGMCRDTTDVCTVSYTQPWGNCCSGNCLGARCTTNRVPSVNVGAAVVEHVPYTRPYTLVNTSSDPDGDPLIYGWSFLQNPGMATLSPGTTAATPTFTPNAPGDYVLKLVVTDGPQGAPNRLTAEATVTIRVENTVPVATATAPADTTPGAPGGTWSRNVPITISGTASDPDGDLLRCAWRVTAPGTTPTAVQELTYADCTNPTTGATTTVTPTVEGLYQVDLVVQDYLRGTASLHATTIATATFTSRNDAPTPVVTPEPVYANLSGPPVTLDARGSSDRNGDVIAFAWEAVTWPGQGTGAAAPSLGTTVPGVATFMPAAEGDYTVLLTVSDPPLSSPPPVGVRPSSSTTLTATVHVARAVKDFGPGIQVLDADAAHGAGALPVAVIVGPNPSNAAQGMLWKVDLSTGSLTAVTTTPLGQVPIAVAISPDGTVAVVASRDYLFNVPLAGGAWTSVGAPWTVSDVVVSGDQGGGKHVAYVFPVTTSNYVRILDLANNGWSTTTVFGQQGALNQAASRLYVREPSTLYKYGIGGNGALSFLGSGTYAKSCTSLWTPRPTTETHVFTGCGDVVAVSTTSLTVTGTLASTSIRHLDTAADGSGAYVSTGGQSILRFDPYLAPLGADTLPHWTWDGLNRAASGLFAFTDGSSRWAIVQGSPAGTTRFGLVTFP